MSLLVVIELARNRSKGDKDPARWLPSGADFLCGYIVMWVGVKTFYELAYDENEVKVIKDILVECE